MPSRVEFEGGASARCCFAEFSPWAAWPDRTTLKETKWGYPVSTYPGVYVLARFERVAPSVAADYLDAAIVYVGEARNLGVRWKQFDDSAFCARSGHSGGWAYCGKYGRDPRGLYVAALPIWFGDDLHVSAEDWTQSYRLYVERRVIWELTVARGGAHGLLNRR